ncbi:SRPBCC family protein [Herbaspirillum sp. ST 5-3]|uniref:SRPBCC family protein n=1 Tax=Oxalobacteraceae TaxID=75682 RepID=UPI0020000E17|nr:SRPBCC family protein [Herbaspirillum sp. ST 5-3]
MTEYRLVAVWHIAAPLQHVFDTIFDSLQWPAWWPGADAVEHCAEGDANGIGSVRRYIWKGKLPYRLRFDACATRIVPLNVLEASVSGDLEGIGRWTFSHHDDITTVHYEWHVHTTRLWMNLAAPAVRSVFASNHHALMQQGAEALARKLGAHLIDATYHELPPAVKSIPSPKINWAAAGAAGIVAGGIATIVQVTLWWVDSYPPVDLLLRDTRLAAAIVLGPTILPPPATFDLRIMLVASVVHLALSLVYGLLLAPFIENLSRWRSALAGCLSGLSLFAINMYGFTALFPWFEASRDWITAAAHAVFGITAALAYKLWQDRSATLRGKRSI